MPRPTPLADLLNSVFAGTPTEKRLKEGKIWLVWDAAVGAQIANRARPVRFSAGVLTIAVNTAPWMQQLNYLKETLVTKLNAALGEPLVQDIYLKVGVPGRSQPATGAHVPKKHSQALSVAERERIQAETASISDPELRAVFAELLALHRCNQHPDPSD
jgi:hypothetical protein